MSLEGPPIGYVGVSTSREIDPRFERACRLAAEIDQILTTAPHRERDAYAVRLAQALTGSLIDQLKELVR